MERSRANDDRTRAPALLSVHDLKVYFRVGHETIQAVDGVSLQVGEGETVALVGESGCGKSVTALSISRLIPEPPGVFGGGSIRLGTEDVLAMSPGALRSLRGAQVAYVFQDPSQSLNPVLRIRTQMRECMVAHAADSPDSRAVALLARVGLADPERVLSAYPHELSGGMRQRVMLAMALACRPRLLIADEPTTALDVTVQAQILELLSDLQREYKMAVLLITHNLGLVAEYADHVYVMYAGQIVESGPAVDVITRPAHPYTEGLIRAVPRLLSSRAERPMLEGIPGMVPNPAHWPRGCRFAERCTYATAECHETSPGPHDVDAGRSVACWHPRPVAAAVLT